MASADNRHGCDVIYDLSTFHRYDVVRFRSEKDQKSGEDPRFYLSDLRGDAQRGSCRNSLARTLVLVEEKPKNPVLRRLGLRLPCRALSRRKLRAAGEHSCKRPNSWSASLGASGWTKSFLKDPRTVLRRIKCLFLERGHRCAFSPFYQISLIRFPCSLLWAIVTVALLVWANWLYSGVTMMALTVLMVLSLPR